MNTDLLDDMIEARTRFFLLTPDMVSALPPDRTVERLPLDLDFNITRLPSRYLGQYRGVPVFTYTGM